METGIANQRGNVKPFRDTVYFTFDIYMYLSKKQWDFGTVHKGNRPTGCNAPGIPAYQISIPISDVFYDPPIPAIGYVPLVTHPAIPGGNFIIDLYEIQQVILTNQPI